MRSSLALLRAMLPDSVIHKLKAGGQGDGLACNEFHSEVRLLPRSLAGVVCAGHKAL